MHAHDPDFRRCAPRRLLALAGSATLLALSLSPALQGTAQAAPAATAAPAPAPAPGSAAARDLATALDAALARTDAKVIAWRRDFHQNPELSNREFRTSRIVAEHLRGLGLKVETGIAKTGVVAVVKGGLPGPTIALRADMDALPITEELDLPFRSRLTSTYRGEAVGVMHACGHDAHTAILMGIAEALVAVRARLPGSVVLIFQPAEEGAPDGEEGGAALMLKQGVFERHRPEAAFGLHVTPIMRTGQIGYRAGPMFAASDSFRILVKGRGTHGARPWGGIDPIVTAAQIINSLQTIVSRQVDITANPAVVTIGAIKGGIRNNVVPDEVEMLGTIRTFDIQQRADIFARVRRTVEGVAASNGATASFEPESQGTPVAVNDPRDHAGSGGDPGAPDRRTERQAGAAGHRCRRLRFLRAARAGVLFLSRHHAGAGAADTGRDEPHRALLPRRGRARDRRACASERRARLPAPRRRGHCRAAAGRTDALDAGSLQRRATFAGAFALVEHDAPAAVGLAAPDGIEAADLLALRVAHRAGAQRERAGVEYLDFVGLPGERRRRCGEEALPARDHGGTTAQHLARTGEEHRVRGDEAPEGLEIAVRHALRELALGGGDRVARLAARRGACSRRRCGVDDTRLRRARPAHRCKRRCRMQRAVGSSIRGDACRERSTTLVKASTSVTKAARAIPRQRKPR